MKQGQAQGRPADTVANEGKAGRVRKRIVYGLGVPLLALNAWLGTYLYVVVQALIWTQTSLLRGPVVFLAALILLNAPLLRFLPRAALSRRELLLIYGMLCTGTCAAGYGFVQILVNQMAAPFYYANGGNGFKERLLPHIPRWLSPSDPAIINGFFRGNGSLYQAEILGGWAVPVLAWSAFIFAVFWTLLCAMTLLRRSWVEEERLTYPLVLIPLEMTRTDVSNGEKSFWRSPYMWLGFIIAGLLESLNFLNFLYPSIPALPIKPSMGSNALHTFISTPPWNVMGTLFLAFYPFVIGIGYLLSLEVSFSCWFLYLMSKAIIVLCFALGLSEGTGSGPANRAPYIREQAVGAFIGIALFSAWTARRALAAAWREMERPTGADKQELMSFRLAIWGGIAGMVFLVVFLIAAGLSPSLSGLFVFAYLCFALTLARIVSEVGAGWAFAPPWSASSFAGDAVGLSHLSPEQSTTLLAYTQWTSDMRDNPIPQFSQSLKMAQMAEFSPRSYLAPLIIASIFGIILAFWAHLDIYYTYGAATAKVRPALMNGATGPARQAATLIASPTPQDIPGLLAAVFGVVVAVGLSLLRQKVLWWPLHPLGYALATTQTMEYMWCPLFLAWVAKTITLRYGGIRAYRAALPFFLGLILGDYIVPTLWGLLGTLTGGQQYMAFPH